MTRDGDLAGEPAIGDVGSCPPRPRLRAALIVAESLLVLGLLAVWLTSSAVRHSKNLWVLFFYCFPSQFILAAVPHEPAILFFGKFHPAWAVALAATAGTLVTELINYTIFESLADLKAFRRICQGRVIGRLVGLFRKAPFPTLWIAGLTPVPFYPFRFMVAAARYPAALYALAVVLSRFPRFYLLAYLGRTFNVPNGLIAGLFLILLAGALVPLIRGRSGPPAPGEGPAAGT